MHPPEFAFLVAGEDSILGVDDPDLRDTHLAVILELLLQAAHRIFWRKNLKDGQRRLDGDLLDRLGTV